MPFDELTYETKPDIFSLEGLIEWLRGQDLDATYYYGNNQTCLLTMYFGGPPKPRLGLGPGVYHGKDLEGHPFHFVANGPGVPTFRAALARAEALLGDSA